MISKHKPVCSCTICELQQAENRQYRSGMVFALIIATLVMVIVVMLTSKAIAYTQKDMVASVIGEAEGESQRGKDAIACSIYNRGNLRGIYGLHSSRVIHHKYSASTYNNALKAVLRAKSPQYCQELVHGAQFWEGTAFARPAWSYSMVETAVIGHQRFFKEG